jgi:predicted DNA-binding protein
MIINNAIFKRDTFLNARVPKEVKKKFSALANAKSKTMSEYILELVLNEFEKEDIRIKADANNLKNISHA